MKNCAKLVFCWLLLTFGLSVCSTIFAQDQAASTLHTVLSDALEHYLEIKMLEHKVEAAEFEVSSARQTILPNVSYSGNDRFNSLYQSITSLKQPIFTFGRWRSDNRIASTELSLAETTLDFSKQDLLLTVLDSYHDLWKADARSVVMSESVAEHQRLFDLISRRVDAKKSPAVDQSLATARLEFARADLRTDLTAVEQIQAQMAVFVGYRVEPSLWPDPGDLDFAFDTALRDEVIANSERLKQSRIERELLNARRLRAEVELLPTVSLVFEKRKGYFEIGDPQDERTYLNLSYETGHGLSKREKIRAAKQRELAADIQIDFIQASLLAELDILVSRLKTADGELERSSLLVESTNLVRESYLRQYTVGRKSWLDVMNASREWFAARLQRIEWQKELGLTAWQIKTLSGEISADGLSSSND